MNNEIQIFTNELFGSVRILERNDGKILFCGKDVAKVLGYAIPSKAVNTHCKGVSKLEVPTNGGIQQMLFITEGDMYRLITHSKLPDAEKFERWVFDEVLPSIRKHGGYDLKLTAYMERLEQKIDNLETMILSCFTTEKKKVDKSEHSKEKDDSSQWFSKMNPKYIAIMNFFGIKRNKLYSEIFTELKNRFCIDVNEVHRKYCQENGLLMQETYIMNVLSKEQVYRMAIEEIIDDSIKENNIDFSNFKKETIFD